MRMTTLRLALPSLLLGVTVACAQDSQLLERTVTRVDPAGGVARSTDGLATLRVPRGALTVATDITMLTRRDVRDPQLRSLVYELGPAGLVLDDVANSVRLRSVQTFSEPIRYTLHELVFDGNVFSVKVLPGTLS